MWCGLWAQLIVSHVKVSTLWEYGLRNPLESRRSAAVITHENTAYTFFKMRRKTTRGEARFVPSHLLKYIAYIQVVSSYDQKYRGTLRGTLQGTLQGTFL